MDMDLPHLDMMHTRRNEYDDDERNHRQHEQTREHARAHRVLTGADIVVSERGIRVGIRRARAECLLFDVVGGVLLAGLVGCLWDVEPGRQGWHWCVHGWGWEM